MSAGKVERALLRLREARATLALDRDGKTFGVFPRGDRRRRPVARLRADTVRKLEAEGVLTAATANVYCLSAAGLARLRRESAQEGEGYLAQHAEIEDREVVDGDGDLRRTRATVQSTAMRRLAALRGGDGAPWLSGAEIAAAEQLRRHWESGQAGLVRGSDWTAPPIGSAARGPGNAAEQALAARCDARRRAAEALDALAPPLRRVVERVCLHEDGLEAMERAEGWPSRSGKLALKLGLAQLARAWFSP